MQPLNCPTLTPTKPKLTIHQIYSSAAAAAPAGDPVSPPPAAFPIMAQFIATRSLTPTSPCPRFVSLAELKPSILPAILRSAQPRSFSKPCRCPVVAAATVIPVSHEDLKEEEKFRYLRSLQEKGDVAAPGVWSKPNVRRKTKIVCTIGPSTNTKEMIWDFRLNLNLNLSHHALQMFDETSDLSDN